jgi:Cu+-exporting ATPase
VTAEEHPHLTTPVATIDLAIQGMTCASCVARVEKRINRVPGARATVNLALETAHVEISPAEDGTTPDADAVVEAVRKAGYDATVMRERSLVAAAPAAAPELAHDHAGHAHAGHDHGSPAPADHSAHAGMDPVEHALSGHSMAPGHEMDPDEDTSAPTDARGTDLRRRLRVATVLSVPVLLLSMIPPLQFTGWQWLVAVLALPVATWAAWPFHRAAARAARHGASTMDTLVSIGIIAATGWSLWALLLGGAGELGMTMTPSLWPAADSHGGMAMPELYLEVAAVVTTFLLAGRYAEHRSRRWTWVRRTSRCWSPDRTGGRPSSGCRSPGSARATSSRCARARRSPPTGSWCAAPAPWTPAC